MNALIPRPHQLEERPGSVTWTSPLRVACEDSLLDPAQTFAEDLRRAIGWAVDFVGLEDGASLEIGFVTEWAAEEFDIVVDDATRVLAGGPAGVAHALTVLRQLGPAPLWSTTPTPLPSFALPRVSVHDQPTYEWRGVHLDVARHFFDVATVCRLIDQMAAHRLNRLHLHLNDDQGWRVEVPQWPRLTSVGATRRSSPVGHNDDGVDDGVTHKGFFTAADMTAIREHASRRFVDVVPEIDLPGHAQAVIAAYPELGNTNESLEVWTRWGISDHVLNVEPATLDFAEQVVTYVASLFPGSPVHIGGDECPTMEWEASGSAQAIMVEHGFTEARQLQGLFTERLAGALRRAGHEPLAWDEVLDATVPEGTVVVAWRHWQKGVEAANRGLDVIMAPMEYLYLDWPYSSSPDEPVSWFPPPFATPWEKVYEFATVLADLEPDVLQRVRGVQAELWTEYIATRDHLDYMAFPRLCAFAEVAWGSTDSGADFASRLAEHCTRLEAMGVEFRPLDPL